MPKRYTLTVDIDLEGVDELELFDFIRAKFNPEDVFPESELKNWARGMGYLDEE